MNSILPPMPVVTTGRAGAHDRLFFQRSEEAADSCRSASWSAAAKTPTHDVGVSFRLAVETMAVTNESHAVEVGDEGVLDQMGARMDTTSLHAGHSG